MKKKLNIVFVFQVEAQCFIKDSTQSCDRGILRLSDDDCRDVDVDYKFSVCNNESGTVKVKKGTCISIVIWKYL